MINRTIFLVNRSPDLQWRVRFPSLIGKGGSQKISGNGISSVSVESTGRRRQKRCQRAKKPGWVYQLAATGAVQRPVWRKHEPRQSIHRQHRRCKQRRKCGMAGKLVRHGRGERRWRLWKYWKRKDRRRCTVHWLKSQRHTMHVNATRL